MKKLLTSLMVVTTLLGCQQASTGANDKVDLVEETKSVEDEPALKRNIWTCPGCTENEAIVLEFLQERGITDKVALSVVMGNIKQESKFHPNICEGGARVPYNQCYSGGFGLIQWTTIGRYNGLGQFAKRYGGDPSDIHTQLRYMVNERQWVSIEPILKTPGLSVDRYMRATYTWLGWGIHGNRTVYSNQYLNRLTQV